MLRRTGVGNAFNNWRGANPRLAHSLPDLALDASCPGHQSWAQSFEQLAA